MLLHTYKHRALLVVNHLKLILVSLNDPKEFKHTNIPYYSQWESPELAADILSEKVLAQDDPLWKKSGALSQEEYALWSWNGCGMACLKMILEHSKKVKVPLVTLAKQCLNYGGYQEPLENSPGLFYKPFCEFVKNEYSLYARAVSALTFAEIAHTIAQRGYVIASVNPAIRNPNSTANRKGGHLILIFGYNKKTRTLRFHNPSGSDSKTQKNVEFSYKQFKKFFAYRGILLLPTVRKTFN